MKIDRDRFLAAILLSGALAAAGCGGSSEETEVEQDLEATAGSETMEEPGTTEGGDMGTDTTGGDMGDDMGGDMGGGDTGPAAE